MELKDDLDSGALKDTVISSLLLKIRGKSGFYGTRKPWSSKSAAGQSHRERGDNKGFRGEEKSH